MLKKLKFYIESPIGILNKLSKRRKKQFPIILILMIITGFFEVITLTSFIPFLSLLVDPQKKIQDNFLNNVFNLLGINNDQNLIYAVCILFITACFVNGIIRMINLWVINRYSAVVGNEVSTRAYNHILYSPYQTQINESSSKKVASISIRVNNTVEVIYGFLQIASGTISIIAIFIGLLFTDWKIAASSFLLVTFIYLFINKYTSINLKRNSLEITNRKNYQIKLIQECLGSTRDIFLGRFQKEFSKEYQKNDIKMRDLDAINNYLKVFPKFLIESVGLIVISLFAFFIVLHNKNAYVIPIIGTFALGAQRLLPLFQLVYASVSMFFHYSEDLKLVEKLLIDNEYSLRANKGAIRKFKSLKLEKIYFRYQNTSKFSIKDLNLEIKNGDKIGIFGKTGSGKSTLVDLIMGFLPPTRGKFYINNKLIKNKTNNYEKNFSSLLAGVAHVPQNIFLADRSIEQNIAFGVSQDKIDYEKLRYVSFLACADEFIEDLPQKYKSNIGENGIRLSGGQRQRIGIARALYRSPDLLILDEATSALDTKTESQVMARIFEGCKKLTIITISHNIKTIMYSSKIIEIKNGVIINQQSSNNAINI